MVKRGRFISGGKWTQVSRVNVSGKKYDTKTNYCWDDPDFPHQEHVEKAMARAKRAGESGNWPNYVDYSEGSYRFKCSGFLKYNGETDCLPKGTGLGRIPVKELEKC